MSKIFLCKRPAKLKQAPHKVLLLLDRFAHKSASMQFIISQPTLVYIQPPPNGATSLWVDDFLLDPTYDPDVFPIDKIHKPNPTSEIIQKIFEMLKENYQIPDDAQYRVIYHGYVQSGKSYIQMILIWYSCFILGKNTVHILMNRKNSLLQNLTRDYEDLYYKIRDICAKLGVDNFRDYIFDYRPFPKYAKDVISLSGTSKFTVYIAMGNKTQLNHVLKLNKGSRETLVIDECDTLVGSDGPSTGIICDIMSTMKQEAEYIYELSATPFSNYITKFYDSVFLLKPKSEYRGFNQLVKHIMTDEQMNDIPGILCEIFARDINIESRSDSTQD